MGALQAQTSAEEKENHLNMLEKTDKNVQNISNELGKRKQNKLANISLPTPKRHRPDRENSLPNTRDTRNRGNKATRETRGRNGPHASRMVSNHNEIPQLIPARPQTMPQPNLLHMTLADLLIRAFITPTASNSHRSPHTSDLSPPPFHPGVSDLGQPPQLPRTTQRDFGLLQATPRLNAQPPQLTNPMKRNFGRRGRQFTRHPR